MNRKLKNIIIVSVIGLLLCLLISFFASAYIFLNLENADIGIYQFMPITFIESIKTNELHRVLFLSLFVFSTFAFLYVMFGNKKRNYYESELVAITDSISIPKKAGQNQYGSAEILGKEDYEKAFTKCILSEKNKVFASLIEAGKNDFQNVNKNFLNNEIQPIKNITELDLNFKDKSGIVVHYTKNKRSEEIYCIADDIHSLIVGSPGSSKTRSVLLQSVCMIGLGGESAVIPDPKGEIYRYTSAYMARLGYEVVALDFRNPLKSSKYNFLQPILDVLKDAQMDPVEQVAKATDLIWDITASLVKENKTERLWSDGEASIIAGSIASVIFDNMNTPEYQNLTNVYYFINHMCTPYPDGKGEIPLNRYIQGLSDNHPAKPIYGISLIAPSRTRGSFFTAALATLKLFTSISIYNMTQSSDFSLSDTGSKKRALYIILPDEKVTYYSVASLFVYQQYVALVDSSDKNGGRLPIRVNFMLEEFGNFTKVPAFDNMLAVSRSRGIRFNLVIQSYAQLDKIYGRDETKIIKDNCNCLIFLQTNDNDTAADISKSLDNYTTSSSGSSTTVSMHGKDISSGNSMNLMGRALLTPGDIKNIKRPYMLVRKSSFDPAVTNLPDLSKWQFNSALGLGSKEHNQKLQMYREEQRPKHKIEPLKLWGIWEHPLYKAPKIQENVQENQENKGGFINETELVPSNEGVTIAEIEKEKIVSIRKDCQYGKTK